jgi:hypothetical protein
MNLEQIIDDMYASMSFEHGTRPNWQLQTTIFAPDARLVRVNDDGVFEFNPQTFRQNYEAMIESGALMSFHEKELWRDTQIFGDIAHVLSAYEMRTTKDGDVIARAIKSIQLFERDHRWWISAMIWRKEGRIFRVPEMPA